MSTRKFSRTGSALRTNNSLQPHPHNSYTAMKSVVLFSTADWKAACWTNKQHVASTLHEMGYSVLYVEGIGMRGATMAAQDRSRIVRRLKALLKPLRQERPGFYVLSLPFIPGHANVLIRFLNRVIIRGGIELSQWLLGFRDPLLWTYHPMTSTWLDCGRYRKSLYHCVDKIGSQPGMPTTLINECERDLAKSVNAVVTTAPDLESKLKPWNPKCCFFPNVADFEHFSKARSETIHIPPDLASISEPRMGFIGAVSGYKLDVDLLKSVAESRPEWSFVLIGEVGLGEVGFTVENLPPNIHLLGRRSYGDLPGYCRGFAAGLLPYRINDYTSGVFPMKFFEYLAAGLQVISTPLPALVDYQKLLFTSSDPKSMIESIETILAGGGPSQENRLKLAAENTYRKRTEKMLNFIGVR